jgi:hypothetical protein
MTSGQNQQKKTKLTEDEQVGVRLPFSRVAMAMAVIMLSPLIPCLLLAFFFFYLFSIVPINFLTTVTL